MAVTLTDPGVLVPDAGETVSHVAAALAVQLTEAGDDDRLSVCAAVAPVPVFAEKERLLGVTVNVDPADVTVKVTAICAAGPLDGVTVMVVL